MKNKGLSLLLILLIYAAAFGAGGIAVRVLSAVLSPLLALFAADAAATTVVFLFSVVLKNASVYDPYWSIQPVMVIWAMYWQYEIPFQLYHLLFLIPLACWSLRLTINWITGFEDLAWEDWRYKKLKSQNPRHSNLMVFLGIMMMPTVLVFLGTIPAWYFLRTKPLHPVLPAIGGLVILLGTVIEYVADSQMRRHKTSSNSGPIDEGLWRYSRHPNYLGEILVWVGFFITGLVNFRLLNVAGVLLIILLFRFISIPMMERHILEKYKEYAVYQKIVRPLVFGPRKTG